MNLTQATPHRSTYGADQQGLICGFAFGRDGIGKPVDADQAVQGLATRAAGDGFV